jgi:spore maturation protein CgeB
MDTEKKNILVIGKFGTEQMGLHTAETLETMGHRVERLRPGIKRTPGGTLAQAWTKFKSLTWRTARKIPAVRKYERSSLLEKADRANPDLVLECGNFLFQDEIEKIKARTGTRVALWFPDSVANIGGQKYLMGDYDGLFFKDPYIVESFRRRLSLDAYYLPECFNPNRHRPPDGEPRWDDERWDCEITTAGNMTPYRARFFEQLADYDVKIWGNRPPVWLKLPEVVEKMHRPYFVADQEKALAFRSARIVVNNLLPTEIWGVNVRTFEAAGVGAFLLMDRQPALSQFYEEGKEVECFSDNQELRQKIDYYLRNDDERREIAQAARKRSLREHTYQDRLELLLSAVFEDGEGYQMPDIEWCRGDDAAKSDGFTEK